jgi:hypothetical protein
MDTREVQRWGVLIGGFAIAAALLAASRTGPSEPVSAPTAKVAPVPPSNSVEPQSAEPTATPAPPAQASEPSSPTAAQPLFEPAGQEGGSSSVSFVVRFEATHPLAQAQNLSRRGKHADAERTARAVIGSRPDLRGLCFDRFTVGGAEIVLRACDAVPAGQRAAFQQNWTRRLNKMSGVQYADVNTTVQPDTRR